MATTMNKMANHGIVILLFSPLFDAPRDKRTYFREINYIAAAFQYQKKNYKSA